MTTRDAESVTPAFRLASLRAARERGVRLIEDCAARVRPGMAEDHAKTIFRELALAEGSEASWHAPQIRFGVNTLLGFGARGPEAILGNEDIFFLDIGPVFDGFEADIGRTYALGNDPVHRALADDSRRIWETVRTRWEESGESGAELYAFADAEARRLGWKLVHPDANGHRIGEFPHAAKYRKTTIEELSYVPAPGLWILEIQIRHPTLAVGAFFEDLLI